VQFQNFSGNVTTKKKKSKLMIFLIVMVIIAAIVLATLLAVYLRMKKQTAINEKNQNSQTPDIIEEIEKAGDIQYASIEGEFTYKNNPAYGMSLGKYLDKYIELSEQTQWKFKGNYGKGWMEVYVLDYSTDDIENAIAQIVIDSTGVYMSARTLYEIDLEYEDYRINRDDPLMVERKEGENGKYVRLCDGTTGEQVLNDIVETVKSSIDNGAKAATTKSGAPALVLEDGFSGKGSAGQVLGTITGTTNMAVSVEGERGSKLFSLGLDGDISLSMELQETSEFIVKPNVIHYMTLEEYEEMIATKVK
jgi:hypothetical protein